MTRHVSHIADEELALLATEELPPAAAAHLASCAECRQRWEQYRTIAGALRSLPAPALPRDFSFDPAAVAALRPVPWWWRYRWPIRVTTLLAATFLVVLLSSALAWPRASPPPQRVAASTPTAVALAAPEPTPAEAGAGGESVTAVQALAGTPAEVGEATPSPQAKAVVPSTDREQERPVGFGSGTGRVVVVVLAGLLALLSAVGSVFGFVLPLVARPPRLSGSSRIGNR
ncbi:MAG: hypothetical protein N2Z82_10745 [Thermomicrobium sp.]|nr:hypothetical protein [Thermomicrobium sp.]